MKSSAVHEPRAKAPAHFAGKGRILMGARDDPERGEASGDQKLYGEKKCEK
jgi:hypothetical protein